MPTFPTHTRIRQYLAEWQADRALVYTDLHRAQVDRIYLADPVVRRYRVGWDSTYQVPFAYRGGAWLFPPGTPGPTTAAIQRLHTTAPCIPSKSVPTH